MYVFTFNSNHSRLKYLSPIIIITIIIIIIIIFNDFWFDKLKTNTSINTFDVGENNIGTVGAYNLAQLLENFEIVKLVCL